MDEFAAACGNRIREARLAAGLTQVQLAEAIGSTQQAVAKWEAGRGVPRDGFRWKLCDTLGCTLDDLFGMPNGGAAA